VKGRPTTADEKLGILRDYRTGMRVVEIAERRRVSMSTVSSVANSRGLRRTGRKPEWVLQSVVDAYRRGDKVEYIAAEFDVHCTNVRKIAKRYGAEMRPSGGQKDRKYARRSLEGGAI
jgi:transposase